MVKSDKHELDVTCVISEYEYIDVCEEYGFDWVMSDNFPVGTKINEGLKHTLKFEYDYLMTMNSDSVIKPKLIDEVYEPFFESLNPYFGIDRVTYVNFYTKEARDYKYDFSVLGVGKCLHRRLVEKGELYPPLNSGLDDKMMDYAIKFGAWPTIVKYEGNLAFDFKSEVNIHPWEKFKHAKDVTGQIEGWGV